jgi:hypothetical protein
MSFIIVVVCSIFREWIMRLAFDFRVLNELVMGLRILF